MLLRGKRPFRNGAECWFVEGPGRWFRCKISRKPTSKITLTSVTGFSHHGQVPWPHPNGISFSPSSQVFRRMRPITETPT